MSHPAPDDPNAWMQWRFADPRASAGQPGTRSRIRYDFARHAAQALAEAALPNRTVGVHLAQIQVSLRTVLFATGDDSALIVVVGSHEPEKEVEKALPYALEHVGDRDLILVIPHGTEWPMLARLPWIDHHTRVFTHHVGELTEHVIPPRSEVLEQVATERAVSAYELSAEHEGWADEVIAWADGHPRLQPSHRKAYLGWQVDGRLVLRINRASGGRLRIAAGVNPESSSPNAAGIKALLDGPLADPEPIREAVRQAVANRLLGDDVSNVEHRFQARLQLLTPPERLGLVTFIPEYPANRPIPGGYGAGSVDFLGVDDDGRLHVVETKVGASEATVFLQALDYWVWVEANRPALAAELGADPELRSAVSVVVLPAADGSIIHRQNKHVADRFSRSFPMKVWTANVDLDGSLRLLPVLFHETRNGGRWVDRMRRRARAAAALDGVDADSAQDPIASVFHGSAVAASTLRDAGGLHGYVNRAHSSQRFALDLYGSLNHAGVKTLLAPFFGAVESTELPQFEWTDEDDQLHECTPSRPARTQVDVFLEGTTIAGESVALLVEVKLTESEFGGCSHAEVAPLPNRAVCGQSGPFGNDPEHCWQLRNRDAGERRRYDQVLQINPGERINVAAGCWFRERNQPMRLAALASSLVASGRFDRCITVLTAPGGHSSIQRRWAESTAMIEEGRLGCLEPERVSAALEPDAQAFLIDRYGLETRPRFSDDPAMKEALGWQLATELFARHADRLRLIETHPGGGQYDCLSLYVGGGRDDEQAGHIDINLEGSLHAWPPQGDFVSIRDVWEQLAGGEVAEVARWCELQLGLPTPSAGLEWPRVMAVLAQQFRGRARWRSGVIDSSLGGGMRQELFEAMPAVAEACRPQSDELLGHAEYRFWFLVGDRGAPLAAVELASARGWDANGRVFDLADEAETFHQALTAARP